MIRGDLSSVLALLAVGVVTLVLPPSAPGVVAADRPDYTVVTSIPLERAPSGIGRLELLEDARIRPELRPELRVTDAGIDCSRPGSEGLRVFCASLSGNPVRPAMLRVVTPAGQELGAQELERALAEISLVRLYGGERPTYTVTVDFSVGSGSYGGPVTRLAEVTRGRLVWLRAVEPRTRHDEEIRLPATPKAAWQFSARRGGSGQDILLVACRPVGPTGSAHAGGARFTISYARFAFEGTRWRRYERTEPGCWESDSPFPTRSKFP